MSALASMSALTIPPVRFNLEYSIPAALFICEFVMESDTISAERTSLAKVRSILPVSVTESTFCKTVELNPNWWNS